MENNLKTKFLLSILILTTSYGYSQTQFLERISMYYTNELVKNDSVCLAVMQDPFLNNEGNLSDFVQFANSSNLFQKNKLLSICILNTLQTNKHSFIGLSKNSKNELLYLLCNAILDSTFKNYYQTITISLFNENFWNDSIQYDTNLKDRLEDVFKYRSSYLANWTVRLLDKYYLQDLFPCIIQYSIKPNFDKTISVVTNSKIWLHIYFLTKAHNKEVLPYLFKAVSKSECNYLSVNEKYSNIQELLWTSDAQIKKEILLNLLKDDCLFKLEVPSLYRNETPTITYFDVLIINTLEQYKIFPKNKLKKLNSKQKIEFVKSWIESNM